MMSMMLDTNTVIAASTENRANRISMFRTKSNNNEDSVTFRLYIN